MRRIVSPESETFPAPESSQPPLVRYGVRVASAVGVLIGAFWLAAWLVGVAERWSATGTMITVKTNTALALLVAGVALLLLSRERVGVRARFVGAAAAVLVLLIGSLTLSEHLFHYNLGIDQLLATEAPGAAATASPNRIGPPAAMSFTLLGAGLLLLALRRRRIAPYFGLAVFAVILVPAVGYTYGIDVLYGKATVTVTAWPTVLALMVLGVGLVLAHPDSGPMAMLLRRDAGGTLLRHVLPAVLVIPLILGFLRVQGQHAGIYNTATGTGLLVIALVLIFSVFLWRSAAQLSRSAAEEAAAQQELRASQERYHSLFENMLDGFAYCKMLFNDDGRPFDFIYLDVNRAFVTLTGLQNVVGKKVSDVIPGLNQSHPELFEIYGRVATTGQTERFEIELSELAFSIAVYSTKRGYFTAVFDNVTARKQAEAAAEASRKAMEWERDLLQTVMNGAKNSHLVYLDRDFNFVRVNEAYARTCGYTPEEMIGKNHFALYPNAENEALFARVRAHSPGEPAEFHDKPFVFPDQPQRGVTYWDWTLTPVKGGNGEVIGLVFSLFETTERKRAEEELTRLASFPRLNPYPIVELDRAGRVCFLNPAAQRLFPDLEQKRLDHPWLADWETVVNAVRDSATQIHGRDVLVGDTQYVQTISYVPETQRIRIYGLDITERKRAEQALQESESRFRAFMDNSPSIAWMKDEQGRIVYLSKTYEDRFGVRLEDWRGRTDEELWPQDMARHFREDDLAVLASNRPLEVIEETTTPNGTKATWLTSKFPIISSTTGQRFVGGTGIDITERKRAEQALIRSEKLAVTGRMAATIAHEINNPLAAATNAVYLASSDPNASQQIRDILVLADQELRRAAHITQQTLGFFRENANRTPVALPKLIEEVIGLYARKLKDRGVTVDCRYNCGPCREGCDTCFLVNAGEMRQIISNLLGNGMDALRDNGRLYIRVSRVTNLVGDGQDIHLTMADNGCGIRAEHLKRIFEPFFTTKESVGTGLGLWITQELVRKHNGSIRVRSSKGKGTVFRVSIPATQVTIGGSNTGNTETTVPHITPAAD